MQQIRMLSFFSLLFLFSCKGGKRNNRIQETETLSFRRTYVGHEHLSAKELEELYKSNPGLETYDSTSRIVKKLNQTGLLKNADLVLSKFEDKKLGTEFLDDDKEIVINCQYDSLSIAKIKLSIENENTKTSKTIDFKGDHIIGILLKDIDDDNIKEILIVTNYYIMNGDNFLLTILQYK